MTIPPTESVVVPRDATDEMILAMIDAGNAAPPGIDGRIGWVQSRAIWNAALAAAPAPSGDAQPRSAPASDGGGLRDAVEAFMPSAEVAFLWSKETPPADEVQRYRERYWAVKEALRATPLPLVVDTDRATVAWRGDGQYEPTQAMIDAGLETNHRSNPPHKMIASFKAMMQQAEIDGLISYVAAHPPADKPDAAGEAIEDVVSHAGDWRTALTTMRDNAEPAGVDHDDPGYWQHQLDVLDRILSALSTPSGEAG